MSRRWAGEITGLSTLLSGSYIQVAPGGGDKTTHFVGLPEPPVVTAGETDLSLILESDDVGSLQVDTPILYRGINVGAVTAITLPDVDARIRIDIAIRGDHASLVRTNSVFWRVSGIHTSLAGLDPTIDIASLATLIRGGISFATPEEPGDPASANAVFELLDAPPDAVEIELPQDGLKLILTAERAGIAEDAPVYYRELPVGKVLQSRLNKDASAIEIEVLIEPAHASLVNTNSVFWNASGVQIDLDLTDPKIDIESLKALLIGGIAFATRGAAGEPVKAGDTFLLHDRPPAENTGATASGRRFILVADELGSNRGGRSDLLSRRSGRQGRADRADPRRQRGRGLEFSSTRRTPPWSKSARCSGTRAASTPISACSTRRSTSNRPKPCSRRYCVRDAGRGWRRAGAGRHRVSPVQRRRGQKSDAAGCARIARASERR